jgi:hypothetical protein
MAIDRTTENQIAAGINKERQQVTRNVYRVGIPAVLLATAICPLGILVWSFIWFVCLLIAKNSGAAMKLCGSAGEDRILNVLSGLPTEYTVFNQIKLPSERSRTGFREADFVVVGINGVFLVENKAYRGRIVGDEHSLNWEQHKIGRGGTPYVTLGRNPVRQVQMYVYLLSGIFRSRGITAWITPLVSLSRDNSIDLIRSEKVMVVQGTDLCSTILAHQGMLTEENRGRVLEVMEELRAGQWQETTVAQQQVA